MVTGVENNVVPNKGLSVGVLSPPRELAKPELYNERKADAQLKQLTHDIYEKENSKGFGDSKKTPLSVFVALSLAAAGGGWLVFKKLIKL